MIQVPRFTEILQLAKMAYEVGWSDYSDRRMVVREFPGAEPKRKHGPGRIMIRIERKALACQLLIGFFSSPEKRLLVAAYDQGIADCHRHVETAAGRVE